MLVERLVVERIKKQRVSGLTLYKKEKRQEVICLLADNNGLELLTGLGPLAQTPPAAERIEKAKGQRIDPYAKRKEAGIYLPLGGLQPSISEPIISLNFTFLLPFR